MTDKTIEFINKAIKIHGYKYDYSKVKYETCTEKVIITCKIHGDFEQTPVCHLRGQGCRKCGIISIKSKQRTTLDEFIKKAMLIHGDKYDYSMVEYVNARTKVIIICKTHGKFEQLPVCHFNHGSGCLKCGIISRSDKQRMTLDEFTKKAKEIHKDKYDYSKVNYINNITKIIIICDIHGDFEQSPAGHLKGQGCPHCGIISRSDNSRDTLDEFIKKAREIHKDKYDYSMVEYVNTNTKVIIICKTHGEFLQTPNTHLSGRGCTKCGIIITANVRRLTLDEWVNRAKEIHKDKYDYSKVDYKKSIEKVIIICKEHGKFEQTPNSHLRGAGCPICGQNMQADKQRDTIDDFINKSKKLHGDKYNYSNVEYINSCSKITIICNLHGEFSQLPGNHLSGNGCPQCAPKQYSKQQIEWLDFISKLYNIKIQHILNDKEFIIPNTPRYKADGYCQETNTIYEFHGDYWHGNPKLYNPNDTTYFGTKFGDLYQKTLEKENLIKTLGYNLVVMWEYDWIKINKTIRTLQRKYSKSKS